MLDDCFIYNIIVREILFESLRRARGLCFSFDSLKSILRSSVTRCVNHIRSTGWLNKKQTCLEAHSLKPPYIIRYYGLECVLACLCVSLAKNG